jgi:CheY-like chemotaxis protein
MGLTILAVDDDEDDLFLLKSILRKIDKSIHGFFLTSGREAIDYLLSDIELPDILFLDINMPIMNGKEILQEIRRNPKTSSLRVIVYSTSNSPADIEFCTKLGAEYLVKNVSFNESIVEVNQKIYSINGNKAN